MNIVINNKANTITVNNNSTTQPKSDNRKSGFLKRDPNFK